MKNKLKLLYRKIVTCSFYGLRVQLFLCIMVLATGVSVAQTVDISGKITDENAQGLIGVTVLEKGTGNGTITDLDGNYNLSIQEGATLVMSSVGYGTQEILVGEQSVIDVRLVIDVAQLDEIVVVGYGTQKKSDLTGSVFSVSEEDIQSRPVTTFADALQGRASGVNLRQTGGDLEGRYEISIRGIGSVTGSNAPLIVVDGIPLFSSDLSTINPKDIASINILKDASAAAIYGARAANGVVIVTTRRGKEGEGKLTFQVESGFEEITKRYDVMNTEQQRVLFVEAFTNTGIPTDVYDDPSLPVWRIDNDWQELGTRRAFRQSYHVGFTGGSAKSQYAISGSITDREGTMLNTDLRSWSLRANIDSEVGEKFTVTGSIAASHQINNFINNDQFFGTGYRDLVKNHTYTPAFDENGNLDATTTTAAPYFGFIENPLVNITLPTRERSTTRTIGNFKLDYELTDGLLLSGNVGGDLVTGETYMYTPVYSIGRYNNVEGDLSQSNSKGINWVAETTVQYEKEFGEHYAKVLAGTSAQQFDFSSFTASGTGTVNNNLNQLANQSTFTGFGEAFKSGLVSYFIRANYDYKNKFLATATVRRDGSSRFGPGNRYGTFPSGSVAWRLSEENFLRNSTLIDDLKLRASYGLTGNQNIGDFAFITKAGSTDYVFGDAPALGNSPVNLGNENLKWEASKQLDIGVNISFFNGRLAVEADYYNKRSEDLLIAQPIPLTSGVAEEPIVNIGSVRNKGFEFSFSSVNVSTGKFSWSTDFNITYNKNEVLDIGLNLIGEPLELPGANLGLANEPINLTRQGHPVGAFYMFQFAGVWQSNEATEANEWFGGATPGDARYADLNGNGIFDPGDQVHTGTSPHPKFYGGLNNTVSYGNFSLNVFMNFATGYQLYNSSRHLMSLGAPFIQNFTEMVDAWTPENPSLTIPKPNQGGVTGVLVVQQSTRLLEDATFLRIKNVNLSYNLPNRFLDKIGIEDARITLTGTNLFTFTNYTGLDPEASSVGNLLSVGIDHTPYPLTRLYSVSLGVTF